MIGRVVFFARLSFLYMQCVLLGVMGSTLPACLGDEDQGASNGMATTSLSLQSFDSTDSTIPSRRCEDYQPDTELNLVGLRCEDMIDAETGTKCVGYCPHLSCIFGGWQCRKGSTAVSAQPSVSETTTVTSLPSNATAGNGCLNHYDWCYSADDSRCVPWNFGLGTWGSLVRTALGIAIRFGTEHPGAIRAHRPMSLLVRRRQQVPAVLQVQ